jgi:hypothetical protein
MDDGRDVTVQVNYAKMGNPVLRVLDPTKIFQFANFVSNFVIG